MQKKYAKKYANYASNMQVLIFCCILSVICKIYKINMHNMQNMSTWQTQFQYVEHALPTLLIYSTGGWWTGGSEALPPEVTA